MTGIFNITSCNIAQGLGESSRFMFHVFLVHISTCIIEGKSDFFSDELFRSLIITAMAIALYHVFFRKIMDPKIEKMKLICYNKEKRLTKKAKIDSSDPYISNFRKLTNGRKGLKIQNDEYYSKDDGESSSSDESEEANIQINKKIKQRLEKRIKNKR